MDRNPLTYKDLPHTYGLLNMTENHGVPGSNPSPATYKSLANSEKMKGSGSAAEAPIQRCVNSRIEKGHF